MLRVLLDFGLNQFTDTQTVADYVFTEMDGFHFDNQKLEQLLEMYRLQYRQGLQPNTKSFLYNEDETIRNLTIAITIFPYELNAGWDNLIDGKKITGKDTSHQDVLMSLNYYKLRKIKKMFDQNQYDMENADMDGQMQLIKIHQHLKQMEQQITKQLGTVILP